LIVDHDPRGARLRRPDREPPAAGRADRGRDRRGGRPRRSRPCPVGL